MLSAISYYKSLCLVLLCAIAEKYFDMNKKQCREALEVYKKFLIRMETVSEFLKVAEVSVLKAWKNDMSM